ncbi:MAG: M48 family metallopeptidase [Desulfocapsa sp.]|nr:M48 family metallopeptidase [Desulfocapsa sp.]
MKTKKSFRIVSLLQTIGLLFILLFSSSCEDTDVTTMAGAGIDAIKAVTLSDTKVILLAKEAAEYVDNNSKVTSPSSPYTRRLNMLVGEHLEEGEHTFNFRVYLSPQVNAFAMADGTIRVNSALMDMMNDGELRFIIGHEMGHVVRRHIKKKMMMAYGGSALRKAIASQNNLAGEISRSVLGSFAETLVNAQFSQQEEREADDYGLKFLIAKGYEREAAVSALRKLATLGRNHSFLSSHPAPDRRALRLEGQLSGDSADSSPSLFQRALDLLKQLWDVLVQLFFSLF